MTIDSQITIITALIKPQMEGRVVRALHDLHQFPGFSLTEVRGQGRGKGVGGAYAATEYDFTYLRHLKVEVVCQSDIAASVCQIIASAAWTGNKGDGVIFTSKAGSFVRIREAGQQTKDADR